MAGTVKKRTNKTTLAREIIPILDSARLISMHCKAFSDPDKTAGGVISASGNIGLRLYRNDEGNIDPRIRFEFLVQAKTAQESSESEEAGNDGKAFEARCTMEAAYTYPDGFQIEQDSFTDDVIHKMMLQLHPLVVSKVNRMMVEMGFTAAYLTLGVTPTIIGERITAAKN